MGKGIFILFCVLALMMGSRARKSKILTPEAQARRKKFKNVLSFIAVVFIGLLLFFFIPAFYKEVRIAMDTHFSIENLLGLAVIIVGSVTFITAIKTLKSEN